LPRRPSMTLKEMQQSAKGPTTNGIRLEKGSERLG
jgi:hypothetical protein